MKLQWYQRNQEAVVAALKNGARPDMATTMKSGPLDDLIGLHDFLGVFSALDDLPTSRQRQGIDDSLLLRTVAVLPFLERASLTPAAGQLFGDPAILLRLASHGKRTGIIVLRGTGGKPSGLGSIRPVFPAISRSPAP